MWAAKCNCWWRWICCHRSVSINRFLCNNWSELKSPIKNILYSVGSTKSILIRSSINDPTGPGFFQTKNKTTASSTISISTGRTSKALVTWYSLIIFAFSVSKHTASQWFAYLWIPSHPGMNLLIFSSDWLLKFVSVKQSRVHCSVCMFLFSNTIKQLCKCRIYICLQSDAVHKVPITLPTGNQSFICSFFSFCKYMELLHWR